MTDPKIMIVCSHCGSHDVRRDAYAEWSYETQDWELCTVFDAGYCENCGGEASLDEIEITQAEVDEYDTYCEAREKAREEVLTLNKWLDEREPAEAEG